MPSWVVARSLEMFRAVLLTAGAVVLAWPEPALAAGADSRAVSLVRDVALTGAPQVLLSVPLRGGQEVFLDGEGVVAPHAGGAVDVYVTVDGAKLSNDSAIDWRQSTAPTPHTFRALDAYRAPPGAHVVALVAAATGAGGTVRAGAQLAVMTDPARTARTATLAGDSAPIHLSTRSVAEHRDPLPVARLLDVALPHADGPTAVLAAGVSYYAGVGAGPADYGDAMWTLLFGGEEASNGEGAYANNDICRCAETRAPMFTQGFLDAAAAPPNVALGASVAPWGKPDAENGVIYRVQSRAKLVVLSGLTVAGRAAPAAAAPRFNRYPYQCVGSSQGWPSCPASGADTVVASGNVVVPPGHNGVVFVSAVVRSQGASKDLGGEVRLWLTVDGVRRGSEGVQGYLRSGVSARTLSAGFLAAGSQALAPGSHLVQVHASATGGFKHLAVTRDLPLIWFD